MPINRFHEIESLASRSIDGLASRADMRRLEMLLKSDPKLLNHFIELLNLDSGLASYAAAWPLEQADAEPCLRIAPTSSLRSALLRWLGAASVLLAMAGVAAAWFGRPVLNGPDVVSSDTSCAVLVAVFDAVWSDPSVDPELRRGHLPAGPVRLISGEIEMLFASGGTAIITGPAVFEAVAADCLRLASGSVRCRCPRPGTELRVETPTGTVIDLGTEFAVSVRPGEGMRVGVIEGRVQLNVADSSRLVHAGEAVSVDAAGQATEDNGFLKDCVSQTTLVRFDPDAVDHGTNLLADPSFESDADAPPPSRSPSNADRSARSMGGDVQIGSWLGSRGYVERVSAPSATGTGAVRLRSNGRLSWPLVLQHIATGDISGQTVMATVKATQLSSDRLTGHQCAIVKIVFVNRDGREFAKAERHFLRAGSVTDRFVDAGIAAVAPPGTVAVGFQVLLNAWGLPGGSLVADDAALVVIR